MLLFLDTITQAYPFHTEQRMCQILDGAFPWEGHFAFEAMTVGFFNHHFVNSA